MKMTFEVDPENPIFICVFVCFSELRKEGMDLPDTGNF